MKKTLISKVLISLLVMLGAASCEIGLGEAVDTTPPDVSISYPPASAIIRESFVLKGSCKDDVGIKAVQIVLVNTDTGRTYPTKNATITKSTIKDQPDEWSITLNDLTNPADPTSFEYADGQYEISVVSIDDSGRSSATAKTIIDIDNTAPILMLSTPGSKGDVQDNTLTTFGQIIKLAGDIAESHTTKSLTVYYKDGTNAQSQDTPTDSLEITGFSDLSSNNPLTIARYYSTAPAADTPEELLYNNYLQIYGSVESDLKTNIDKEFFCSLVLSDNAKVYKDPVAFPNGNDALSNVSTSYYVITSDVKNMMDKQGYGLDVNKIQKILNNTSTEYNSTQIADIKARLDNAKVETKFTDGTTGDERNDKVNTGSSKFLVNPHNNPTWEIGGYAQKDDQSWSDYSVGRPMTLVIKTGKDNVEIKPTSVTLKIKDSTGNVKHTILDVNDWDDSADTTVSYSFTLEPELGLTNSESHYTIDVSGEDRNGNPIEPTEGKKYGFKIVTANNPPEITVEKMYVEDGDGKRFETTTGTYWAGTDLTASNKKIKVLLNVKTDSVDLYNDVSQLSNHLKVYESDTDLNTEGIKVTPIAAAVSKSFSLVDKTGYSYNILLTLGGTSESVPSTGGVYKYSFYVVATDTQTKSKGTNFYFYIDNKAPEITVNDPTPLVVQGTNKFVNGKINIKGLVSDNVSLNDVSYEIYKVVTGGTDIIAIDPKDNSEMKGSFGTKDPDLTIDTTKFNDDDEIYVKFILKDDVGNEYRHNDNGSEKFTVKQSTDAPNITGNNFYKVISKDDLSVGYSNVNQTVKGNIFDKNSELIGVITDDDGIDEAVLQIWEGDSEVSKEYLVKSSEKGNTSISFNQIKVPQKSGYYTLAITAKDSTYEDASYKNNKVNRSASFGTKDNPIWIAVDNENPTLTETNVNTTEKVFVKYTESTSEKVTFSGSVKDDLKLSSTSVKITWKKNGVDEEDDPHSITPDADGNWSYDFELKNRLDAEYTLTFTAEDIATKKTTIKRTVVIDNTPPVFTNISIDPTATWYNTTTLTVKGDISDALSGVSRVYISYNNKTSDSDWQIVSGLSTFSQNITMSEADGNTVINLKAVDKAGNEAFYDTLTAKIDVTKPLISFSKAEENGKTLEVSSIINGRNHVVLSGTCSDNEKGSGVSKIDFCINNTNFNSPDFTIDKNSSTPGKINNSNWTLTIPAAKIKALDQTSNNVYARIYDDAGNYDEQTIYTLTKDAEKPSVTISPLLSNTVNKSITLKGTAYDEQTLSGVTLAYYVDVSGKQTWTYLASIAQEKLSNWSLDIDTESAFGSIVDDSHVYICVIAEDSAGNKNLDTDVSGTITDNTKKDASDNLIPNIAPASIDTENIIELIVNQDSDRPIIKFNNIDLDGMTSSNSIWLKNTGTLLGTITDDDGISYFGYSITEPTFTNKEAPDSAFTEINVSNGSWSLPLEDKGYNLYFKVRDSQGNNFYSCADVTASDAPVAVKLHSEKIVAPANTPTSYDFGNSTNKDTRLFIKVDTETPKARNLSYASSTELTHTYNHVDDTNTDFIADVSKLHVGGNYKSFAIKVSAQDTNGIKDVWLENEAGNKVTASLVKPSNYNNAASHDWILKDVDITGYKTSNAGESVIVPYTLVVQDNAELTTNTKFQITVDNKPATLNVESHENFAQIGDAFVLKGTTVDTDKETSIKYIIDSSETEIAANNSKWDDVVAIPADINDISKARTVAGGVDSWRIYIDGDVNNPDGYTHDISHKNIFVDLYNTAAASGTSYGILLDKSKVIKEKTSASDTVGGNLYKTVKKLYFHFLITDRNGNTSTAKLCLNMDPQGDIPTVAMTYPTKKADGSELRLSGIIRAQGTAFAKNGVNAVYMQIDPNYNGTTFNDAAWKGSTKTSPSMFSSFVDSTPIISDGNNSVWGIKVGDSTNWSYSLNKNKELDGVNAADRIIAIRLYCVDKLGIVSEVLPSNDLKITIDSAAPRIGSSEPFYVYRYADNEAGTGDVLESKEYKDNMWLSGIWWLQGSVEDEGSIDDVTFAGSSIKSSSTSKSWAAAGTSGYVIKQKIGSTANDFNSLSYVLTAKDNDGKPSDKTFTIRYDNKPPVLEGVGGSYFDISTSVVNTDGFYTLGSAAYEDPAESGFERVIFYFERTISGYENVYDSYLQRGTTGSALSTKAGTTTLTKQDGIYFQKGTISKISGTTVTFTVTADDFLKNIHKGGLVKLGGSYYVIKELSLNGSTKSVTLDGSPSESLTGDILFAIGHVVDYDGSESVGKNIRYDADGYGYYSDSIDNVDDWMIERTTTQNGRTVWYGSINSNNIPDGKIDIHYVAFDKAGNISELGTVSNANVENNAPRIASVKIWYDYNANGNVDKDESETVYYSKKERVIGGVNGQVRSDETTNHLVVSGNGLGIDNGGSAYGDPVKAEVGFIPEIVGGNGKLYYTYTVKSETGDGELGEGHNDGLDTKADNIGYYRQDDYKETYIEGHTKYDSDNDGTDDTEYRIFFDDTILKKLGNSESASKPTWFDLTIWDSTEGTTPKTNSLNSKIQVALNVQYTDNTRPKMVVNRFGWISEGTGKNDKGQYYNNLYEGSLDNGHIELEADWEAYAFNADKTTIKDTHKDLPVGLQDKDPKVSGKITIRGTAYDDIRIGSFKFTFPGIGTNVIASEYQDGIFDSKGTMAENGWFFSAEDVYNNKDGHKVNWELSIDTSKVEKDSKKLTATDVTFEMYAVDARGGNTSIKDDSTTKKKDKDGNYTSELDTSDSVYNRPTYKMDIVPYIRRVHTSLSDYSENHSVYDRTTSGHYPVYQQFNGFNSTSKNPEGGKGYEQVTLIGFNLAENNGNKPLQLDNTYLSNKYDYKDSETNIIALNNYNNPDIYYNKQPNEETNNLLTDDIIFDIWQINSAAAKPDGDRNLCDNVTMKINPSNGMIGFSFSSGDKRWAMPKANDNSYQIWGRSKDFCKSVAFAYMSNGITLGVVAGGESGENYSDAFSFYNSQRNTPGNDTYTYASGMRIESISQYGNKDGQNTSELNLDKDRFQSSSFASLVSGDNRYVYLAYYDQMNGEIRFRAGNIKNNNSYGTFTDDYSKNSGNTTIGSCLNGGKYDITKVQVLASGTGQSLGYSGQYVSIAATSDNTVAMVWYDSKNNCLRMAYTTSPETSRTGAVATGWTNVGSIMANGGDFCQLVVDSKNNFHVAAYDNVDGDLKYIYIPKSGTKENSRTIPNVSDKKECIVDSYQSVGKYITLDVAKSGNYQIPYIGYWGSYPKKPRYAYLAEPANIGDGVDDDGMYTGVWECTIVPTPSKVYQDQLLGPERINVGVWKNASGELTNSTGNYGDSTASGTSGKCYGNGTSNAVLGYQIDLGTKSYVETAQMKRRSN